MRTSLSTSFKRTSRILLLVITLQLIFQNIATANAITNAPQSLPVSSVTAYRYLKITALEPQKAGTNHTFLSEVDVFTTK